MKIKLTAVAVFIGVFFASAQEKPVYLNVDKPIEERVEDALKRMTLEEKIAVIHAQSKFSSAGVPRLGIPENWATDGPHGIRAEVFWDEWNIAGWTNDSCIAFPALTCLAATWNTDMAALYGKSIGEEARYRNKNILLGPGVNIYRTPLNGRNFEYMGEDPCLASKLVVPYIKGVQANGVAACVKHFALNNQETDRYKVNVNIDDRALNEIYLPAFKAAVKEGDVWAVMGAYNKYMGEQASHNKVLLNDILKKDWQFDGVVISDWDGTHDTKQAIHNGLDMEFGTWLKEMETAPKPYSLYYLANPYYELIKKGEVGTEELDDKVRRVLRLVFRTNMAKDRPFGSFGSPEHSQAARKIAEEGIVLLKNKKSTLPISLYKKKKRNILVVGENAVKRLTVGGGSSSLKAKYEISPFDGIKKRAGSLANVTYAAGYKSPAVKEQDVRDAKEPEKETIDLKALRNEAVRAAQKADMVVFVGGLNKNSGQDCEDSDRANITLPYEQDLLIKELLKANKNTVVVIISGNAVAMPWADDAPAIVEAWYNGSEAGSALAGVLFGDVNPSGKLPFTFFKQLKDFSAHAMGEYPGNGTNVAYRESVFVGYRWANRMRIKPLFGFGHGLSYTTFKYSAARVDKKTISANDSVTVSVKVKNTGYRAGQEVVQLYINDVVSAIPRPRQELKGFQKIYLKAGEEKTLSFVINKDDLSYYNEKHGKWIAERGEFEALFGSSSEDIREKVSFKLK
ncbi:glycosyl hydrolase [Bacteroidia bacterium]|nr:glycosyl hydrolase [Bacteroidia bacterium]